VRQDDDYGENARVLIEAGVLPGPPPPPYDRVIEDLSSEEVEALISVKARFDQANQDFGGGGNAGFMGMVAPL
jgi:hypothetical protein